MLADTFPLPWNKVVLLLDDVRNDVKENKPIVDNIYKPVQIAFGWLIVGYISALLGGLVGLLIGIFILTSKITLLDGNKLNKYDSVSINHGTALLIISLIAIVFWISVNYL